MVYSYWAAVKFVLSVVKSGYVTLSPARSKRKGVAGTDWNLGTAFTALKLLFTLSLDKSRAYLPKSTKVTEVPEFSRIDMGSTTLAILVKFWGSLAFPKESKSMS